MAKPRVLLVDPQAPSIGQNLALALLGAVLNRNGFPVKLLDQNNRRVLDTLDDLILEINHFRPDIVGFTLLYLTQAEVAKLVLGIRKFFRGSVIIGGPQVKILRESVFDLIPGVDYVFEGESEESLLDFCSRFENRDTEVAKVSGTMYKRGHQVIVNPPSPPSQIDESLYPDFSLYGVKKIKKYSLMTSRGCPYACTYCFRAHSRNWRAKTPESIIRELQIAREKYHIEEVWVHDEAFNIKPERVIEICRLWMTEFPDLPWACAGIRADHVTPEMAKAMRKSGCHTVGVGIETLDPDVFKIIDKRETTEQVVDGVKALISAGINVRGNFIIGLPGDTYESTMKTFSKALKLGMHSQSWTLLLPIPGTEMYDIVYNKYKAKFLNSYLNIDMIWMPDLPEVKCAFELPEFPAKEKIKAYYQINTRLGLSLVRHPRSRILRIFEAIWMILYYAPMQSPELLFRLFAKYTRRVVKGESLITSMDSGITFE